MARKLCSDCKPPCSCRKDYGVVALVLGLLLTAAGQWLLSRAVERMGRHSIIIIAMVRNTKSRRAQHRCTRATYTSAAFCL